jgi:hypothetical protein
MIMLLVSALLQRWYVLFALVIGNLFAQKLAYLWSLAFVWNIFPGEANLELNWIITLSSIAGFIMTVLVDSEFYSWV